MKILFATQSMRFGGAERVMSILLKELAKSGNEVYLLLMDDTKTVAYDLYEGINLIYFKSFRFKSLKYIVNFFKDLKKLINEISPDVAVSFFSNCLTFMWIATRKNKIPLVYSERNDPNNNIKGWKAKLFQYMSLKKSKHIVFQTTGAQNYYGKKIISKSSVIANPFSAENLPDKYVFKREKRIVSVGRLTEQKNQKLLIEAFSSLPKKFEDYTLTIYGEGELRTELEQLIKEKNMEKRIFLPGASKKVLNDINNASVFVFSSDFEGLPNALIEAMALGLPCVSTDCSPGGAREFIINYENGILVPCNDVSAMTTAIVYMLENFEQAKNMGIEATKIIAEMSPEYIGNKWLKVFNSVIKH